MDNAAPARVADGGQPEQPGCDQERDGVDPRHALPAEMGDELRGDEHVDRRARGPRAEDAHGEAATIGEEPAGVGRADADKAAGRMSRDLGTIGLGARSSPR